MTPSEGVIAIKSTATTYDRGLAFWGDEQLQLVNPAQSAFGVSPAIRGRVERVDFQLSSLQPDQDGDGLPDWWELLYPTASEPGADTDEDGLNNLAEFIAGTNPADRNSKLALSNTLAESDGSKSVRIVWRGVPGRSYRVLRAPLLSASPGDYEVVASREATAEGDMIYEDAPSAGHYFYRVEVVLP
jgi:hypothetical protein